jgi:AAA+ ATPase superfamily predicted ATPase
MKNPFHYGGVVRGEAFCNRKKEVEDLLRAVENGEKLFVYSERRFGKTSLIRYVLDKLPKKQYVSAYVDLWPTDGALSFPMTTAKAIAESMSTRVEKTLDITKSFFGRLAPSIVQRYGLRSASNAQRAIESLLERDVIDRDNGSFMIVDRFFRIWVQKTQKG